MGNRGSGKGLAIAPQASPHDFKGSITSFTRADGTTLDLSASPLEYTGRNPEISDAEHARILEMARHLDNMDRHEFAVEIDSNGVERYSEIEGKDGNVRTPIEMAGNTFIHTHPRNNGVSDEDALGGTLSNGDLQNFAGGRGRTYVAVADEGIYSITKKSNFDRGGFRLFVLKQLEEEHPYTKYKHRVNNLKKRKISFEEKNRLNDELYEQYKREKAQYDADGGFNGRMARKNQKLIDNQEKYGYVYTLERRK